MSPTLDIPIRRLSGAGDLELPNYASAGSAGLDLRAAVSETLLLYPGKRALLPCGFSMALPSGYEAQIRPRSGLALNSGFTILNAPGTIDSDYRGEIGVIAINLGEEPVSVRRGDRIAQMVITPVTSVVWKEETSLPPSSRETGGFGSTGTG